MTSYKILGFMVAALLVFVTLLPGESAVVSSLPFEQSQTSQSISSSATSQEKVATKAHLERTFGQLPLYFVENQGQMDEPVAYYIQGSDKTIYFTSGGVTFVLTAPLSQTAVSSVSWPLCA